MSIRKFDLEGWESGVIETIEPTPEVLNINLIDIIQQYFEDNTAGPYYPGFNVKFQQVLNMDGNYLVRNSKNIF